MAKKDIGPKPYVLPKLYTRKNDLSKRWFIRFQAWNTSQNRLETKTIYCPAKFRTAKERKAWASDEIKTITKLLHDGYGFGVVQVQETPTATTPIITQLQNVLNISSTSLAPKTMVSYQSSINKFSEYLNGGPGINITGMAKPGVILFRDFLLTEKKNSPRTANNTIENLKSLYSRVMERSGEIENPFSIKKLRIQPNTKNMAFSDSEKEKLENYLKEHEPELFIFTRFLYYGFIRPGELINLRWSDVAGDYSYITVKGAIAKNNKTETAPVIPALRSLLESDFFKGCSNDCYIFGKGLRPGKSQTGKQVAFRRHEKALKAIGLDSKQYTLYSWKHTGAVNAYRSGVGVKELQSMLRHSTILITDIYLKSLGLRVDPGLLTYNW